MFIFSNYFISNTGFCRLQSYDLEKSHICLRDGEKILDIDAKLVEPCNATVDSHWMFIGEIACDSNSQMYLKARVAVCIDALDFPCFRKALEIKRSYLCQKSKDL